MVLSLDRAPPPDCSPDLSLLADAKVVANVTVALYPQIDLSALLSKKLSDIDGTAEVIQVIKRFMDTGLSVKR